MSRSGFHAARNGPWQALFPGICAGCKERFPIGTMIARRKGVFVHDGCSPPEAE